MSALRPLLPWCLLAAGCVGLASGDPPREQAGASVPDAGHEEVDSGAPACDGVDAGSPGEGPRPLDELTGPWQLFLDDALVEDRSGVRRVYHPFTKHPSNPIMKATEAWEDKYVYVYGRVMHQEGGAGFRMWYSVLDFKDPAQTSRVLYATSADGLSWVKPKLGLRAWNGSTQNNLFIPRNRPNHILSVMHTPWDAACPYKFLNYDGSFNGLPAGYSAACSPDGVHLTDLPQNPVLTSGGDVAHFTFDPFTRQYLGYVKVSATVTGQRRRAVGLTRTGTFGAFPAELPVVLQPDAVDDLWATGAGLDLASHRTHFYGVSVFPYQTMFLGLLWIFRASDPPGCTRDCAPPYQGYLFGKIHLELASSRDGVYWTRIDGDPAKGRPPLLPLGQGGAWDSMMLFSANHPVLEGQTLRLYYGGCNEDHALIGTNGACSVGLATLRRDGFASLDATTGPGSVTTKPLVGASGELLVNFRTESGGSLRVEVQDDQGRVVPGYSAADSDVLSGDHTGKTVRWGGRSALPSFPCALKLVFLLERASLYSYSAGPGVRAAH